MGDPDADFDALLAEQADLQTKIDAANAWDLERTLDIAMDALRVPPPDADVSTLSGGERRRVALCRLLLSKPDLLAARRADQPPRRRVGGVARAHPAGLQRHSRRDHPRPLLPRQRRAVDSRTRSWARHSVGGQLLLVAGAEAGAPGRRREGRQGSSSVASARTRVDSPLPRARQSKGKARVSTYNQLVAESESADRRADKLEIAIPPGPRLGDVVVNAEGLTKGFDDRLLIEDLTFLLPPGGHRRA